MTEWFCGVRFSFLSGGGLALGPVGLGILTTVHSKLSVWTAQKRTRLVAIDSASARTSVLFLMWACGIATPPRVRFLFVGVPGGVCYCRLRQPPHSGSLLAGSNE